MSIAPNMNLVLGGVQLASMPGAIAVEVLDRIFLSRHMALTHDAYTNLGKVKRFGRLLNVRLSNFASLGEAPGAKTELSLSVADALSALHIVGEHITVIQTELRFASHTLVDDLEGSTTPADEEGYNELLAEELVDQLTSSDLAKLFAALPLSEFLPDGADEEQHALALVNEYGGDAVEDKLTELDIAFDSGEEEDEEDDEEEDFPDEEDEEDDEPSEYSEHVLTLLVNDLSGLGLDKLKEVQATMQLSVRDDLNDGILLLMAEPTGAVVEACRVLNYDLPSFTVAATAIEEDPVREQRLLALELDDLELLCDLLQIDHDSLSIAEMVDVLVSQPHAEFYAALEAGNITLPETGDSEPEESLADYAETFDTLSGLTMMQSALASCLAQRSDNHELVLSFTH